MSVQGPRVGGGRRTSADREPGRRAAVGRAAKREPNGLGSGRNSKFEGEKNRTGANGTTTKTNGRVISVGARSRTKIAAWNLRTGRDDSVTRRREGRRRRTRASSSRRTSGRRHFRRIPAVITLNACRPKIYLDAPGNFSRCAQFSIIY